MFSAPAFEQNAQEIKKKEQKQKPVLENDPEKHNIYEQENEGSFFEYNPLHNEHILSFSPAQPSNHVFIAHQEVI